MIIYSYDHERMKMLPVKLDIMKMLVNLELYKDYAFVGLLICFDRLISVGEV